MLAGGQSLVPIMNFRLARPTSTSATNCAWLTASTTCSAMVQSSACRRTATPQGTSRSGCGSTAAKSSLPLMPAISAGPCASGDCHAMCPTVRRCWPRSTGSKRWKNPAPASTSVTIRSSGGRCRCHDNIFVERLWWTVKHEWVYLRPAADGIEQKRSLGEFFDWYNLRRPHQALGWRTPDEAYLGQSTAATALAA